MTYRASRLHGQRLLWGRALLYGLLTEAILTAIFAAGLAGGMAADGATLIALVGSFVLPLLFATILGRRLQARFVLHGVLIGVLGRTCVQVRGRWARWRDCWAEQQEASSRVSGASLNEWFESAGRAIRLRSR